MPPEKVHARNEAGQPICGAKCRDGHHCQNRGVMRNGRCRMHGGSTPIGPAHGAFKHGKYSLANSVGLGAKYDRLRTDPNYIELREEVALLDSRLSQLWEQFDFKGSGELIRQLREQFNAMRFYLGNGRSLEANACVLKMADIFDAAYAETLAFDEISRLIELRRRLVSTERERLVAAQQMITAEELDARIAEVGMILRQRIKDPNLLSAIAGDLRSMQVRQPAGV